MTDIDFLHDKDMEKNAVKGFNMISLQTIFPNVLFVVVLFISLLISSFICITEIKSSANQRVHLIRGIFLHELASLFISTAFITTIPILCVLLVGEFVFKLHIFGNLFSVMFTLVLVASVFILIGMLLSYLIKKESITLLVVAFVLVFFIFISGFLLPAERMNEIPGLFATNSPLKIGLTAFNKIIFHAQGFNEIIGELLILIGWFVSLLTMVIIIKKLRE